ncbi:MAG: hypothetical protein M1817_003735 [Caeruleum heppii]|nr:MAG: hypothetical protein M1817_003735 [Caeruleum heppii]
MDTGLSEPEGADSVARTPAKACDACRARKMRSQGALLILPFLARALQDLDKTA